MTIRPIIFNGPMVRALLDGSKTQTRRILKATIPPFPDFENVAHLPKHERPYLDAYCGGKLTPTNPRGMTENWCWWTRDDRPGALFKVGYVPGDLLYVRENFWHDQHGLRLQADKHVSPCGWKPSIHMPRATSRLTLEVTAVRVERVASISESDASAEGVKFWPILTDAHRHFLDIGGGELITGWNAREVFAHLWDSINEKRGFGWVANPWVVAVTFKVHRVNVDQIGGA